MPTTRRRFSVTETDDLSRALDVAAVVWPQDAASRPALLRRLIELGAVRANEVALDRSTTRDAAVRDTAGIVRGVFPRAGVGTGSMSSIAGEWAR